MSDPMNCPVSWCEEQHPEPRPQQVYIPHRHDIAEKTLLDGTVIDVVITWYERLGQQTTTDPRVMVFTHTGTDTAGVDLEAGTAGMLAEAMALAGDGDRWLAGALADAAALLGYSRDDEAASGGAS